MTLHQAQLGKLCGDGDIPGKTALPAYTNLGFSGRLNYIVAELRLKYLCSLYYSLRYPSSV